MQRASGEIVAPDTPHADAIKLLERRGYGVAPASASFIAGWNVNTACKVLSEGTWLIFLREHTVVIREGKIIAGDKRDAAEFGLTPVYDAMRIVAQDEIVLAPKMGKEDAELFPVSPTSRYGVALTVQVPVDDRIAMCVAFFDKDSQLIWGADSDASGWLAKTKEYHQWLVLDGATAEADMPCFLEFGRGTGRTIPDRARWAALGWEDLS